MRVGALFAGYGGLELGVAQAVPGVRLEWTSEVDAAACAVLEHRWPGVPNLGDVAAVDWSTVAPVDVLTGGFPCQDVSGAGRRRGLRPGTRSGLWAHMRYAVDVLRPRLVIAENVRGLLNATAHSDVESCPWCLGNNAPGYLRALGAVLGDLASLGYDAQWHGLRAADIGACHGRFRVFIIATDTRSKRHGTGQVRTGMGRLDGPDAGPARERERPRKLTGGGSPAPPANPGRLYGDPWRGVRAGAPEGWRALRNADGCGQGHSWGEYAAAVTRWEQVLGRPAPAPTEPGPRGGARVSACFVEWMMGLPAGWVTDVPGLSWSQQLKLLGNGVVPQQAAEALRRAGLGGVAAPHAHRAADAGGVGAPAVGVAG